MESPPTVVILIRDLILGSRVIAAARNTGTAFAHVRDASRLAGTAGTRLIVDLNQDGAIEAAGAWLRSVPGRSAVGFVSHIDAAKAKKAKEAGVDRVLARSRLVELLPEVLDDSGPNGSQAS